MNIASNYHKGSKKAFVVAWNVRTLSLRKMGVALRLVCVVCGGFLFPVRFLFLSLCVCIAFGVLLRSSFAALCFLDVEVRTKARKDDAHTTETNA